MPKYTEEDKDRGLLALVMFSNNSRAASRALEAEGERIPHQTLDHWRKHDRSRYEQISQDYGQRSRNLLAMHCEALAQGYSALERQTLERAFQTLGRLEPKDLPNAARSYATAKAIQIDKSTLLRGLPTSITESRSPEQIMTGIAVKLGITKGQQ